MAGDNFEKDYMDSLMQVFFKIHFQQGDSIEIIQNNLCKAEQLYKKSYYEVDAIADEVDGAEDFPDPSMAILSIQTLSLSEKYMHIFKEKLSLI